MALILIRGENKSKLLSAVSDMERHGSLTLTSKPKLISAEFADSLVEQILKSKIKTSSNVATAFFVKEDTTLSILKIKQIHPPAHVVVVSNEYKGYDELKEKLTIAHEIRPERYTILGDNGISKEEGGDISIKECSWKAFGRR